MPARPKTAESEKTPPVSKLRPAEFLPRFPGARRSTLDIYTGAAREHEGEAVVRIRAGCLFGAYLATKPEAIGYVLRENHANYLKGKDYDALKPVIGGGLLTSEGEYWRRQRRLVQPAFHRDGLASLASSMVAKTEAMLERWEGVAKRNARLDVSREMTHLTLKIVVENLFGARLDPVEAGRIAQAFAFVNRCVDRRMSRLLDVPAFVPTPENLRYGKSLKVLNGFVARTLEEHRRREDDGPDDLLHQLVGARDRRTGERMTAGQLRDEVMTILLAGHETTANCLSWTWHLLSENPKVRDKLHGELQEVLGGRPPAFSDLGNLAYTRMVLEESLRLYPRPG